MASDRGERAGKGRWSVPDATSRGVRHSRRRSVVHRGLVWGVLLLGTACKDSNRPPSPPAGEPRLADRYPCDRGSVAMEPVWGSGAPNPVFDFYNYWMTMHTCSGCGGSYWGNALISRTAFTASDNTWACIEVHAKLNADVGSDAGAVLEVWKD